MSGNVLHTKQIVRICLLVFFFHGRVVFGQLSTVSVVVDGDRIILSDGRKVKLAGVDAPELHPSAKLSRDALAMGKSEELVARQGRLAAEFLTRIAGGRLVRIRTLGSNQNDEYVPAIAYLTDRSGRLQYSLNQQMIASGYAAADLSDSAYVALGYMDLERKANLEKRGLWVETSIFVAPQATRSHDAEAAILSGSCARDSACVWVTAGDLTVGAGMWKSKPGRKCGCAIE